MTLDEWAHSLIRDNSLTKTQYYNAAVIIRQVLALAVDKGMLAANLFSAVKVQTKMFRTVRKKPNESQVFMTDEQPLVEKEAWRINAGAPGCRIRKYCSHTMATVKTLHKIASLHQRTDRLR